MFCPHCGNQLPEGASFCAKCGTRAQAPSPAPQVGYMPQTGAPASNAPVVIPAKQSASDQKLKLMAIAAGILGIVAFFMSFYTLGGYGLSYSLSGWKLAFGMDLMGYHVDGFLPIVLILVLFIANVVCTVALKEKEGGIVNGALGIIELIGVGALVIYMGNYTGSAYGVEASVGMGLTLSAIAAGLMIAAGALRLNNKK